jgi:hypothetical protein
MTLIWLFITGLFMVIKYWGFYPENIISLNNFLTLGAILGAILIGIGSNNFAKKQLEINEKSVKMELAIRYKDHYCALSATMREIIMITPTINSIDIKRLHNYVL